MGYRFHGGCVDCDNDISVCPSCRYMEPDWSLPTMNPKEIKINKERSRMKSAAYLAAKSNNLSSEIKDIFKKTK